MDLGLNGLVAVVTGGSQGIGLAIAEQLADESATVIVASRSKPATSRDIESLEIDLFAPDAPESVVDRVISSYGRLDIVINNLGAARLGAGFLAVPESEWLGALEVNLLVSARMARASLTELIRSNGVLVNVSSTNARFPDASAVAYSAAKAALDNLTRCLASEFGPAGVRVVGVAPGPVGTPMWLADGGFLDQLAQLQGRPRDEVLSAVLEDLPGARFVRAEDVAAVTAFLASGRARAVSGTTVLVDNGLIELVS